MSDNFGDFQLGVYADAVKGVNSRYPFDFRSIERKAAEALPDWVYRYVSAAAGDGRTQQANINAFSHYGIVPRMMVSPQQTSSGRSAAATTTASGASNSRSSGRSQPGSTRQISAAASDHRRSSGCCRWRTRPRRWGR